MLSHDWMDQGLTAIHAVMIKARWMSGERESRLYLFLDHAEVLPTLLAQGLEHEFRQTLNALSEDFPDCAGILTDFERARKKDNIMPASSAS